jgi:hypothetical protein
MTRINSRLMDLMSAKENSLPEVAQIIKRKAARRLENRRAQSNRFSYRQRCSCFQPSKVLEDINQKMFHSQNLETQTLSTHEGQSFKSS